MRAVNKYKEKYTVYIGRGSVFGNPFKIGIDGNREEVVKKYRNYTINNKKLLKAICDLPKDSLLGCYCKPKSCHGDVIVEIYDNCWGYLDENSNN